MPVGYRVEVYYRELNRATVGRGGPGGRWIYRLSTQMLDASKAAAPVRDGGLRRAHRLTRERGSNQWVQRLRVSNTAEHSVWVHDGTTGPIRRDDGGLMTLPPGGGYPRIRTREVSGQTANPWLERACSAVAMRYGAVPVSL